MRNYELGGKANKKKFQKHKIGSKLYTLTDLSNFSGRSRKYIKVKLKEGWSPKEIVAGKIKKYSISQREEAAKKQNINTMKCKTCGMEFGLPKGSRKRYCSKICKKLFKEYPNEFGLWWQE